MSLKDLDFLSQEISLFFYGRTRHSSNIGGIFTLFMIFFCIFYIFYLILEVYLHKTSTIQYYRHFFKNPGIYSFNDTNGIFHFFQIYNTKNNNISFFNSKYIRLFMLNNQEEYELDPELLSESEHWVYDSCQEGIDNKNMSKELFENISFESGYCLRYYYNYDNKKYYSIGDTENFKYPYLTNLGIKNVYTIGTIIEKCNNDSVLTQLFGPCGTEEEIQKYLKSNNGILINVLTNEIRPGVYNQQIYNFIYGISNSLKKNVIIENELDFTPLLTIFRGGIIFNTKKESQTYSFTDSLSDIKDRNEKSNVVSVYSYYLSQSGYIFKSSFQTIYDSFHKIGGIIQLIYYIFFGLNYLFNKYNIINDTKKLFFMLHNDEKKNGNLQVKNFSKMVHAIRHKHFLEKSATEKIGNIAVFKRQFNEENELNHKCKLSHKCNEGFFHKNLDIDNSKNLSISPFVSDNNVRIDLSNKTNSVNVSNLVKDEIKINKISIQKIKGEKSQEYRIRKTPHKSLDGNNNFPLNMMNKLEDKDILKFKLLLKKFFNHKKKKFLYEKMTADNINDLFSLGKYLASLLLFYKKPRNYYLILEKFRKKLLSEEHFFRTHNFLYLFEKCFDLQESKKIDIIELYKNL